MRHPDFDTKGWGFVWFSKYSLFFGVALVFLVIAFSEEKWWFLGLSAYLACAVIFLAIRAANEHVRLWLRIPLFLGIIASWAFTLLLVFAEPGDTQICYDRLRNTGIWTRTHNLGPDPNCDGIPLQDIDTD